MCILNLILFINVVFNINIVNSAQVNGRYTRDLIQYQLSVPHRITAEGGHKSFKLPEFYNKDFRKARHRRYSEDAIYYNIIFDGVDHHVELWPNHGLFSPDLVLENYTPNIPVSERKIKRMDSKQCHYVGRIKGDKNSRVALSVCDGLAGYLITKTGRYYIEPLADVQANANGEHVHVVYRRDIPKSHLHNQELHGVSCRSGEDWTKAWEERFRKEFTKRKIKSNLQSHHRYLETLVVVDKKFLDYHKHIDYQNYIMTIMNMVSDFYHDSTIGNQMDVVVVRIIYLNKEEEAFDLLINPNAEETLQNFCKWQEKINPSDLNNPNHHDIAILLTRYDICSDNLTNCDLMGLAYVAAACTGDKPCAINEDAGLTLGVVVAHEIGHVMGCSHDNEVDSSCKPNAPDGSYHVMSPYVHLSTTIWSKCSKTFVTQFFENNLGDCLNDEPQESLFKDMEMPPGAVYDGDFQCNLLYPDIGATVCKIDEAKFCKTLFCKTKPNSCSSNGDPPADGTKCGENKWCFNGVCETIGNRPQSIDGGWGKWGSWSTCSRTCGGGIKFSERICDNPPPEHNGRYCIGERKKVAICNTESCGDKVPSFRSVQCTERNLKPFKGTLYNWKPFLKADDMCSLYCINEKNTYVKLEPRVKDGTNCKMGTRNKCIFGVCRTVGCNWKIDSDALDDKCGVCQGDGSSCKFVEEIYKNLGLPGYQKVVTFSKGSRNIFIEEVGASPNTITIGTEDQKTFYLNGNYEEELDGFYDFEGTGGIYEHPEPNKETLKIAGPISTPLTFFVTFFERENPGFKYSFADMTSRAPLGHAKKILKNRNIHWDFLDWDDCSKRCGSGIKISKPSCVEEGIGKVSGKNCKHIAKPKEKVMKCNERPCKSKWRIGSWGQCSGCKFHSGMKSRAVECVTESETPGTDDVLTDDSNCSGAKPSVKQLCCSRRPCSKTRRDIDQLDEMIGQLWFQINRHIENKERRTFLEDTKKLIRTKSNFIKHSKIHSAHDKTRFNLHQTRCRNIEYPCDLLNTPQETQTMIKDEIPPEEKILIDVPILKNSEQTANSVPDEAIENMGDNIVDVLDFCHESILKGAEAIDAYNEIEKDNLTNILDAEVDDSVKDYNTTKECT